jgi:hypothetical protein
MFQFSSKFLAASLSVLTVAALSIPLSPAAFADSKTTNVLKSAGVGALGGAVLGGVTERQSIGKGALYGAGAGAGAGLINNSNTLRNRDGVRRTAAGAVIGAGAGGASGRSILGGAALGAGAGLGYHVLKGDDR